MKQLRQKWYNVSIQAKCILLMGTMLVAIWILIASVMLQLRIFTGKSSVIMNDYSDITSFLNTFSTENVSLDAYMRPIQPMNAKEDFLIAIADTDRCLEALRPDWSADGQEEYAIKRAICNAMKYYRECQNALLDAEIPSELIDPYLSLKTQSSYIDGYSRDLLRYQMVEDGKQWQQIAETNSRNTRFFTAFLILVTGMVSVLIIAFRQSVLRPLDALGQAADTISTGRYDAPPLHVHGDDELGRTARSFNLMQSEIRRTIRALERQSEMEKHLLEKEVEAEQMQRKLQERRFAQLQSQINPHFLFNTLNTIAAFAHEERAPLSEDLILRLSHFFRYSLESDEKIVSLEREILLLRDYMELQETRYGDRITMEIQMDPALKQVLVPKFILQPLVENAIMHGLRDCGGQIRVRAFRGRKGATILVTDNGCGFDTGQQTARSDRQSVGLMNIRERMELNGGRFDVFSRRGLGTCVRLIIKEEDGNAQNTGSGG